MKEIAFSSHFLAISSKYILKTSNSQAQEFVIQLKTTSSSCISSIAHKSYNGLTSGTIAVLQNVLNSRQLILAQS